MTAAEKPPTSTRFKKGTSGNPRGRPKAAPEEEASAFRIITDQTLSVTQNGVSRQLSVEEALQHQIYVEAINGVRGAQKEVLKMIEKREKARAARGLQKSSPVRRIIVTQPDNVVAALKILGIATPDESLTPLEVEALLLETWAVEAALAHRHGGERLKPEEAVEIQRRTRNPKTLKWPRAYGHG